MTASQQPDAGHAPLTSPAAAGSGSTGHDKAVEIGREIGRFHRPTSVSVVRQSVTCQCGVESTDTDGLERHRATLSLAALRAALAAGDTNVAQALDVPSLLAAAKADALRDAAAKWQQGDWTMVLPASLGPKVIGLGQRVTDWLRAQADRAEADGG